MRFEKYLSTDVLGCYRPGTVISVHAGSDSKRRTATVIHECTHLGITSASTLGVVGILCGLVMVYSKNPEERAAAEEYVRRLCIVGFWIQEGAATANEVALEGLKPIAEKLGTSLEIVVEPCRTYVQAASDILDIVIPITENIDKGNLSLADYPVLLGRTAQAVAISAMSPTIDDSFVQAALSGHSFGFLETLRSLWPRFLSIKQLPEQYVAEAVQKCLPTKVTPEYVNLDYKLDLAKAICKFTGLNYGGLLNAKDLAKRYVPDLADHVQRYDAKQASQNDISLHYATGKYHNIIPENIVATETNISDLSQIEAMGSSCILIAEAISMSKGSTSVIIHRFDDAANYLQSLLTRQKLNRELLEQIVKQIISRHKSACCGIVVGLEIALNRIGNLLEGFPVVALPFYGVAPDEVKQLDCICSNEYIELHRILLKDGNVCWQVVAVDSTKPCRQMNLDESCYSWVLSNGMTARARWKLQYG